jgi:hypothetical protein
MSYKPDNQPTTQDIPSLIDAIWREFRKIEKELEQIHDHEILHTEPSKLYDGMDRYADGTDWDPIGDGSEGRVSRENGTWVKL